MLPRMATGRRRSGFPYIPFIATIPQTIPLFKSLFSKSLENQWDSEGSEMGLRVFVYKYAVTRKVKLP